MTLALVLGGGGSAGVGWEIGVLTGLADEGVQVRDATTIIGTSAGAIVGVRLRTEASLEQLFAQVTEPVRAKPMALDFPALAARWAQATQGATSAEDGRARIGTLALAEPTMTPQRRRAEIAAVLPGTEWPDRALVVTAVDAHTGRFVTFTAAGGVDLVSAVGASCAVPGVWPPVEIGGTHYVDGAVRSPTNVSVAAGHDAVLVVAPLLPELGGGITRELASLGETARSIVIAADDQSLQAFGPNPLDVTVGPAAAAQGRRQGRVAAAEVARLLREAP